MGEEPVITKKKRRSLAEAHAAVLQAGKALLRARGLDAGLGQVTLNDAIIESGVPRASAYRAFERDDADPQVAFRSDLIASYIRNPEREQGMVSTRATVLEKVRSMDPSDAEALSEGLRDIVRWAIEANVRRLTDDPAWRIIGPSWVATSMSRWIDDDVVAAHADVTDRGTTELIPIYQETAERCGLRLRPGADWKVFSLLVEACSLTASFYHPYGAEAEPIMRPTGPGGEEQPWTRAAQLVEGVVMSMLEADPDADASVDLQGWLR